MHIIRLPSSLLGALWLCGLLVAGCGVDTDALICAEGRQIGADKRCEDKPDLAMVEPPCLDASSPGDLSLGDAREGSSCTSWRECPSETFCDAIGAVGFGRCVLKCTDDAACTAGQYCSAAGVCLQEGGVGLEGDACEAALDCASGLICVVESGRCEQICDPRAVESGCEKEEQCVDRVSGLGFCAVACE